MKITGIDGINRISDKFREVEHSLDKIYNSALYDGAGIVADEVAKGIDGIPIETNKKGGQKWGTPEHPLTGITPEQKQDLKDGFGVARFKTEGGMISTSVGFEGYGHDGFPIPFLARTIESGTSFRKKHPFVRPAFNRVKKAAVEAVKDKMLKRINEIIK